MGEVLQSVRGMNDMLPEEAPYWQHIEAACRRVAAAYGYQEIRPALVEKTALFRRSIGEVTDIVEKEMYSFDDRNGDNLSLRPEATAGVVRAGLQHGLLYNQVQRFWYMGPMWRHERPQKGRTRQFHQFGLEAFGMASAAIDAEIIIMSARLWQELGLQGMFCLQLNSLGTHACRQAYREALVTYMQQHLEVLDEDSKRRLHTNPLRILDSKNPALKSVIEAAPRLADFRSAEAQLHFQQLCDLLDQAEVSFEVNPYLVRGLDYYSMTVFEWVTNQLGAQGTVAAGGRYDRLVSDLGSKKPVPAVGCALGLERLQLILRQQHKLQAGPLVYVVIAEAGAVAYAMRQVETLRTELPGLTCEVDLSLANIKTQFKRAALSGARWAMVCGAKEMAADTLQLKPLHAEQSQQALSLVDMIAFLRDSVDTL